MNYKITPEIADDIETLHGAMLCTIAADTVIFEDAAVAFFNDLPVEFSRKTSVLLRVGVALGILSADQVADWQVRRAEYEKVLGDAYDAAKAAGKNETEARAEAKAAWQASQVAEPAQAEVEVEVKHDGFDGLRRDLSPLVKMDARETFTGTFVVTLTIPNPLQYHRSFFALCEMRTVVRCTFYYADFRQWNGKALVIGKIEDWRGKANEVARQMLESAQHNPVAFFQSI